MVVVVTCRKPQAGSWRREQACKLPGDHSAMSLCLRKEVLAGLASLEVLIGFETLCLTVTSCIMQPAV